jgi:hypothetical protein
VCAICSSQSKPSACIISAAVDGIEVEEEEDECNDDNDDDDDNDEGVVELSL